MYSNLSLSLEYLYFLALSPCPPRRFYGGGITIVFLPAFVSETNQSSDIGEKRARVLLSRRERETPREIDRGITRKYNAENVHLLFLRYFRERYRDEKVRYYILVREVTSNTVAMRAWYSPEFRKLRTAIEKHIVRKLLLSLYTTFKFVINFQLEIIYNCHTKKIFYIIIFLFYFL